MNSFGTKEELFKMDTFPNKEELFKALAEERLPQKQEKSKQPVFLWLILLILVTVLTFTTYYFGYMFLLGFAFSLIIRNIVHRVSML